MEERIMRESRLEKMIDFDKMTANQVNELMAEEVMGWHREGSNWCDAEGIRMVYADNVFRELPWSPYDDIADAWEVAENLLRQGIEVIVCGGFSGNLSACMLYQGGAASYPPRDSFLHLTEIEKSRLRLGGLVIRTQAETVSLAICYAALEYEKDRLRRR